MKEFVLSSEDLQLTGLFESIDSNVNLKLSETLWMTIEDSHKYLTQKVRKTEDSIYGVNTGFGSLCQVSISKEELKDLQINLIRSHAAGVGSAVPSDIVKLMLLLKVRSLSIGFSGVSRLLVERLIDLYNYNVLPVVKEYGSLGASGDLAPLAHLSLPLIGEGEVEYQSAIHSSIEINKKMYWNALELKPKEGIALLNGTQFTTAYLAYNVYHAIKIWNLSNLISAISIDAYDCMSGPFDHRIHLLRRQQGQIQTAREIRNHLKDSEIFHTIHKDQVQDPYSFRCIPQVHGASYDSIEYCSQILEREINAVTDNPLIFSDADEIISGGNFHAQPVALALDQLSLALAELGSISERRIYKLMGGKRGIPEYLSPMSGLHSGMMIAQYTAASLASDNKHLCQPSSMDNIDSSNGQEDHVSMGANAGKKCYKIVQNIYCILGIELMAAAQAIEFRRPRKSSSQIENLLVNYRQHVPVLKEDRQLSLDIDASIAFIKRLDV
jgi:histidine ammonia-lyase